MTPETDHWSACTDVARRYGRSFYLASMCLPPHRRRAVHAAYAYCRVADDIVDQAGASTGAETERRLAEWQAQLRRPVDPVAIAFAQARVEFNIPERPAIDLLDGIRMDLEPRRYATWTELRRYCHGVAGTVGLISAPILGCRDGEALERAAELGVAMQLTNILRDIDEDAGNGRLYLPLDELATFGCDPDAVLARRPDGRFADLIAFQIARARELYRSSLRGVGALTPSGRLTTLAAARFYSGILHEIEAADYDVFQGRAHVSSARKLRQTPSLAADFIRLSLMPTRLV